MKTRHLPNQGDKLYSLYLCTVGKTPAAKNLMKILKEEWDKGNDYFKILKHLSDYATFLNEIGVIKNKGTKINIATTFFKIKQKVISQRNEPEEIKKYTANVLSHYYRRFKETKLV